MKRFTFLLFTILFSAFIWQGMAQIAIGEQGPTTSSIPISGCWEYSYTQQLVYSNEVNASGDITSISFYYTSGGYDNSLEWDIYLGHTSKTMFEDTSDWVEYSSLEQVYSGSVTFPDANEWMTITFDTPFTYNGTDNLVIGVDENMDGYSCSAYFGGTPNVLDSHRSIIYRSDSTNPDPVAPPTATTRLNYINTMILGGIQQSCPTPTDLAIASMTDTTADVEWTLGGSETTWNISWGTSGYTPGDANEIDTATVTTAEYQITGLTAETSYDVYVQSDCSEDELSTWAGPLTVFTGYCQVSTTYGEYLTSISSNGAIVDFSYAATAQPAGSYANETSLVFESHETQTFDIATTYSSGQNGVNVWVDWNNNMSFDDSELIASENGSASQTLSVTIPSGTPEGDYRMRVRGQWGSSANPPACGNVSYGSTVDFTLTIVAPPSCLAPIALTSSDLTTDSAKLSWTPSNTETEWEVIYGEAGFDPLTEGETISVNDNPEIVLNDLMASTLYDFYVKAICDVSDESALAGPVSFRTACDAIVSLPYIENFDTYGTGSEAFPACWERVTYTSGVNVWPSIVSQNAISGSGSLKFQSATDSPTYAISPAFAEDITNLRTTFMLKREGGSSGTIDVGVMSDASDISTFELVQTIDPANNNYHEYTIDFNQVSLSGSGNFIALRHNSNSSVWYYWLDDFEVNISPSCMEPTALNATNISPTTADIEWTAGADETSWDISWGTQGYTPGGADEINTVTVTSSDYQITGLSALTVYDVNVRAICVEAESDWTNISFTSGGEECVSPLGITVDNVREDGAVITWTAANASDNQWEISLTTGGQGADQGLIDTVTGIPSYSASDLEAETTYSVYLRTICSADVSSDWAYNGLFTTLEGEEEPEECDAPTVMTVDNVTEDSAEITWSAANVGDNQWEISLTTSGQSADQGLISTVTGTPFYTATDLAPETTYSVSLRTICSNEESSDWAYNGDFTTLEATQECDAVTDVEVSEITAETATVSWTASATAVDGYVVNVYEAGADVDTDTAVFTEVVGVGVTTVDVTGLTHLTSYDVYVTSDCGSGETAISDVVTFTTDDIASIGDFDFVKLTLYPNPVSTDLNVSAAKVIDEVQVYNILGQRVMTHKSNNTEVTLDVTSLPSATYVLKVSVEGVVSTARFVKK